MPLLFTWYEISFRTSLKTLQSTHKPCFHNTQSNQPFKSSYQFTIVLIWSNVIILRIHQLFWGLGFSPTFFQKHQASEKSLPQYTRLHLFPISQPSNSQHGREREMIVFQAWLHTIPTVPGSCLPTLPSSKFCITTSTFSTPAQLHALPFTVRGPWVQ